MQLELVLKCGFDMAIRMRAALTACTNPRHPNIFPPEPFSPSEVWWNTGNTRLCSKQLRGVLKSKGQIDVILVLFGSVMFCRISV